jgi:hypothetical protein
MKNKKFDIEKHKEYVEFLRKRVQSENFKNNTSKEEYEKTLQKYDKAKLVLKIMSP